MASFMEVMEAKLRMCEGKFCPECKLSFQNNGTEESCGRYITTHPKESEEYIMKWAEEHPKITNRMKFEEVFGIKALGASDCVGFTCPPSKDRCEECPFYKFWDKEYEEIKK